MGYFITYSFLYCIVALSLPFFMYVFYFYFMQLLYFYFGFSYCLLDCVKKFHLCEWNNNSVFMCPLAQCFFFFTMGCFENSHVSVYRTTLIISFENIWFFAMDRFLFWSMLLFQHESLIYIIAIGIFIINKIYLYYCHMFISSMGLVSKQ